MKKPSRLNKHPTAAFKAAMANWKHKRAAVTALPEDAPDSVFEPAMSAACDAECAFANEPSPDWPAFRVKFEAALFINENDVQGWKSWIGGMTQDIRHLAGPMTGSSRAALSALKAAHRRPPRDPEAPPTHNELWWTIHQLRNLLGREWLNQALPEGLKAASDEQMLAAIASAPEPAIAYRPGIGPDEAGADDWSAQDAWGWLLDQAEEVPTIPWPKWLLSELEGVEEESRAA